jgi:hypothetical protein
MRWAELEAGEEDKKVLTGVWYRDLKDRDIACKMYVLIRR